MSKEETKTGQSTDYLKSTILNPILVRHILTILKLRKDFSFIDIGSGDGTFSLALIKNIIKAGHHPHKLAFVDKDEHILPSLIKNVNESAIPSSSQQILNIGKESSLVEFLEHNQKQFDIALAQLVLHQIENIEKASDLIYFAYQVLKSTGVLLIVNLHPQYLQYLANYEPAKFRIDANDNSELNGKYYFDSGGSSKVHSRSIETQLAMFLNLGFDFFKLTPITTDALSDQKVRYRKLAEHKIPMFYLLQLKKS